MHKHIMQSREWGEFKITYGTKVVNVKDVQYTVHKIPFTTWNYAYCPRVIPSNIDWSELEKSLKDERCVAINFDVPNVVKSASEAGEEEKILRQRCSVSPKDTFARFNILLDLTKTQEDLFQNMHTKHRYNVKLAEKKGLKTITAKNTQEFEDFYKLLSETAVRQKYYIHPKDYYQKLWELMSPKNMCQIKTVYLDKIPLASWMLFFYEKTLYYPYGGSSDKHKNLFASNLIGWEAIKAGKQLGMDVFDMWGACDDLNDTKDPWWGFTNFKLKFGGKYVEYINSYDLVLNKEAYKMFNLANTLRWKLLKAIR